uniref:Uncharacterized protein n=1 Tax=Chroomonas placoidea TaxID=173977 RepID=A0A2P1G818_9CRYP|nr:hypothetical protein CplaMt_p013 [Chroomonas placoidea]AVM81092.1 hypothetical protein CplaMt_p013 [Chroomonas placoidea]
MRSYFNYTSKLSVLLTNARLLELSHNQILEDPANLVFDINLSHHFSRNNNLRLSNKINKAIKNEKKSFFENSRSVLKQKKYIYKDLFFQDLVLKQIVVNILNKVFEIEKEKYILPVSFYITKTNKEASKALNLILKKTSVGFYSSNCKILNALTLAYFVKIIKQTILDQKFIKIVERLFGALEAKKKLAFKSSKCYQVFCNIYFGRFDIFIMEFLKKQINKVDYKFTNIQRKSLNHIEFLVSKALLIAKKIVLVNFKHNYSKKSTVPVVSYVRYLSHFFIGSLYLNGVLNNFFNKASFFLKSTLHLDVKMSSWVHLNLTSIAFCGIEKKKHIKLLIKVK